MSWSSSNSNVASVSGGKITGKSAGSATITARFTYGGNTYSATYSITVKALSLSLSSYSGSGSQNVWDGTFLNDGSACGNLVNLPDSAKKVFEELNGGSPASYAIRFAAGFDGIMMVLSGMSSMEQMKDNLSYMKNFKRLNEKELDAVAKVQKIFKNMNLIPCTACRYCEAGCPKQIKIPDLFAVMNTKQIYHDWNADYYYNVVHTAPGRKASDCIKCGKCEKACPQHLNIRTLLESVAKEFEKLQ